MKRASFISTACALLFLFVTESALAQITPGCMRSADETTRIATAQALLSINASNYQSVINYWAEDVTYKEPVLTNSGRQDMLNYLTAVYAGTAYGFPNDKLVTIKDELHSTKPDGSMTYMATLEWSGTVGTDFFVQTGMSIMHFRPAEGCPYYHRDYFSEGDSWWNIPAWRPDINILRDVYISIFGLTGRCFDYDGDGYTKYNNAAGCPNVGLDCNDFVADINPGATELPGNGINDDCNIFTQD